jgi:hypothetical protein
MSPERRTKIIESKQIDEMLLDKNRHDEAYESMVLLLRKPLLLSLREAYDDGRPPWLFCSRYSMLQNAFIHAQTGFPIVAPTKHLENDQLSSIVGIYDPPVDNPRGNTGGDHTISRFTFLAKNGSLEAFYSDGVEHLLWDGVNQVEDIRFFRASITDLDGSLREELQFYPFKEERAQRLGIDLYGNGSTTTMQGYKDFVEAMHHPLVLHGATVRTRYGTLVDTDKVWDTRRLQKAAGATIKRVQINGFDTRRLVTVPHI